MARSKETKRYDRLINCVRRNNVKQLKQYVKRKKYRKLKLENAAVNKRRESLLLLASRLTKVEIVNYLLNNSIYDPLTRDSKGNSALHLALKALRKVHGNKEFIEVYRNLILPLLSHIPISMEAKNNNGETIESLLDIADTLYQHYLTKNSAITEQENSVQQELEWQRKLVGEVEDEYETVWGRYEADFLTDTKESEDYDAWAARILRERRQKHEHLRIPPTPKEEEKDQWTGEDQRRFLQDEEEKRHKLRVIERKEKRTRFCSKLLRMAQKTTGSIGENDLPFTLAEDATAICDIIVMELEELEDPEARRKCHRDLQRLWHPDKFAQKFGSLLPDDIRPQVLKKITEISQALNVHVCKTG